MTGLYHQIWAFPCSFKNHKGHWLWFPNLSPVPCCGLEMQSLSSRYVSGSAFVGPIEKSNSCTFEWFGGKRKHRKECDVLGNMKLRASSSFSTHEVLLECSQVHLFACGNQLFSGSKDEVKEETRPYGPQACILASSRKSSQLPCSRR